MIDGLFNGNSGKTLPERMANMRQVLKGYAFEARRHLESLEPKTSEPADFLKENSETALGSSEQAIAIADPKPGDKVPDGTIYAGISPNTGRPLYVAPADAPGDMPWEEAMNYANQLDAHGHKDWRVPTKAELNVIFNNRAAIGGLTECPFWSSSEYNDNGAWYQRFGDGIQYHFVKRNTYFHIRCARG